MTTNGTTTTSTTRGGRAAPASSLAARIQRGAVAAPLRVLLYGAEGVGKTSFGAAAPGALFLCTEKGTEEHDIARVSPVDWPDALGIVRDLAASRGDGVQTLVVDTLDWLQGKVVEHICRRDHATRVSSKGRALELIVDGKPSMEGYPFNHGWDVALEEWRAFVAALEALRAARGTHVVLLAHAAVQKEKNLEGNDYGIVAPAVNRLAADLFVQWCGAVLYAVKRVRVVDASYGDERAKRAKAVQTEERVVHAASVGAFRAKNRYALPAELPLDWHAFAAAVATNDPVVAAELRRAIDADLARLRAPARVAAARAWLATVGIDVAALRGFAMVLAAEIADVATTRAACEAAAAALPDERGAKARAWLAAQPDEPATLRAALDKLRGAAP